jgi:putative ABC transport system permease protein
VTTTAAAHLALHGRLIAAEWRHQPGRVGLALLALAVGVALAFAVHLVNASALAEFGQAVRSVNGQPDLELRPTAGDTADFDEHIFERVAATPGVAAASPVLEHRVRVRLPASDTAASGAAALPALRLVGIDALSIARMAPDLLPRPAAGEGRLALVDPAQVYLNPAARRVLGEPAIGTLLQLDGVGAHTRPLRVAGTVAAAGGPLLVVDIAGAQQALGRIGRLSRIAIQLLPGQDSAALLRSLDLPPELRGAAPDEAEQRLSQLSRSYRVNLSVLALVALFTGAFLVYAVQALAVAKRVPQLALLGVLGMDAAERRALVLTEAGLLGALGSALGLALGAALAQLALARLGGDLGSAGMLGGLFGAGGGAPPLQAGVPATLAHGALGLAAALAGSWFPARAAEALVPAHSLKGVGAARHTRPARGVPAWLQRRAGPLMLLAGALLALLPPLPGLGGLPLAAYLSIACILLGGVVCVPAGVGLVLARLRPPMTPLPLLVIERARDQRDTATATVAGVVASLALCVALTVMVASFRASVTQWLDRVLPADLYVRAAGLRTTAALAALPEGFEQAAAKLPGVAQVRPQRVLPLQLDAHQAAVALLTRPINLNGSTTALAAELPLVESALPARAGCINVAVSEAMVALHDARPGRVIELPLVFGRAAGAGVDPAAGDVPGACAAPRSGKVQVFVRAVWRDYARQQGALVMDRADWLRLGGDGAVNDLAVWLQPGAPLAEVQAALRRLARPPGQGEGEGESEGEGEGDIDDSGELEFATPGEIRALSLAIFDRSFVVTRWLQGVAIALGLVGVAASFSAQVLARRKEFGALQHLGVTRRQLLWLVAGEGALWCGLGALIGLALGLVISVILVHVVNPQSFHWTMELALPWARLWGLVAAVLGAGSLAAAIAGRAAASRQMALAVKEDW